MLINELPQDHKKMLKFYLDFWIENRKVLLNGKLTAENPEIDYSSARATLNGTEIITPYTNSLVEIFEDKSIIITDKATKRDNTLFVAYFIFYIINTFIQSICYCIY